VVTEHIYVNASGLASNRSFMPRFYNCNIACIPNADYVRAQTFVFAIADIGADVSHHYTGVDMIVNCIISMGCNENSNDTLILVKTIGLGVELCIRNSTITAGSNHGFSGAGFKFYVVYNTSNSSVVWLYYNNFYHFSYIAGNYYWYRFPTAGTNHTCRVGWNVYDVYKTEGTKVGNLYYDDVGDTVVTETSFGQSATAGISATYSRVDHTHGTPIDPTASISSSTASWNLSNTTLAGLTSSTAGWASASRTVFSNSANWSSQGARVTAAAGLGDVVIQFNALLTSLKNARIISSTA
jgi:hypothetical protein